MPNRISILLLAAVWTCPTWAAEAQLRFHHMLPPVAPAHWAMIEPWVDKVEAESGDRIDIDIYPAMQLGGQSPALLNQVRDGVVDIVWTLTSYTPGRFPSLEVFELPTLMAHPDVMNRAIMDFVDRHPGEFRDYRIIAAFVHAGQALHSKVPITTVDDLAGLKIRIPSRIGGWIVEALGATPIGTPASKIPELLSKGVVDGAMIPFEVVGSLRVNELVDHHVVLDLPGSDRFNTQVFMLAMNHDAYESLPPDLRAVIDDNSGHNIAGWLASVWMDNERPGIELARESGEVSRLPRDESIALRALLDSTVTDRWIATMRARGLDGDAILAEARELIAAHSRPMAARNNTK